MYAQQHGLCTTKIISSHRNLHQKWNKSLSNHFYTYYGNIHMFVYTKILDYYLTRSANVYI